MPPLPRVTAGQTIRVLEKAGFVRSRSSGSHHIYINAQGRRVTVSVHAGKILHPKVLKSILADAVWTVEEFIRRLAES
jgi:predicted RNA binding protein YcfA (HicA-like mRNA interferase family)